MREGLAVVVETEMRAAYEDLWYAAYLELISLTTNSTRLK